MGIGTRILALTTALVMLLAVPAVALPAVVYDSGHQSCSGGERITVSAYSQDWAQAKKDGGSWYTTNPAGSSWHRTHTRIHVATGTWVGKGPGLKEWLTYSICQAY